MVNEKSEKPTGDKDEGMKAAPGREVPDTEERHGDSVEQAHGKGEKREGNRVETKPSRDTGEGAGAGA